MTPATCQLQISYRFLILIFFSISVASHSQEKLPQLLRTPGRTEAPQSAPHPIDGFIFDQLKKAGLSTSPPADSSIFLRRAHFVLTGLPPTPEQVSAFEKNSDPEEMIDELLNSPRYGERWAQHWLDIIRWAETVGFETNLERKNAWHYRDWVIDALNSDKPYDEFVFEQIAGDTEGVDAALGFLVAGPANLPGQIGRDVEAMRQARQDELDEVIRTVSQSLLGLTIGCARCHDHKFDPITERDYYAMQAIFSGLTYGDRRLRGMENDLWADRIPEIEDHLNALKEELENQRLKLKLQPPLADVQTDLFEPIEAQAIRMVIYGTGDGKAASLYEFEAWSKKINVALAANGATPNASSFALSNQTRHFDNLVDGSTDKRQAFPWVSAKPGQAFIEIKFAKEETIERVVWHRGSSMPADYLIEVLPPHSKEWKTVGHALNRLPRTDDTRAAEKMMIVTSLEIDTQQITTLTAAIRKQQADLARLSAGPQTYAANFSTELEPTFVLKRGDPMQNSGMIAPAIPVVLGDLKLTEKTPEPERRVALATHLTRSDHPLTARVIVNRVWQYHFGAGLISTTSDFGKMGAAPTHPELLDFLAVWFVENGWSLKKLHRLIMTSQTFQQSSRPNPDAAKVDADSRLLWRFPPRRLEAEAIRDTILAVSGKLNLETGGPGWDLFNRRGGLSDYTSKEAFDESGWRRMIYAHKIRMQAVDIFSAFDCPDGGQLTPTRTQSITPLQSLSLLNSPFANRQATFFAERVKSEAGLDLTKQIDRAFQLAYSRSPLDKERSMMIELAHKHGLDQVCRAILNSSEFVFIP
ncbi:MAG: DUF1549 and DUF1553 domain-containing protein [Verrucomicrobiales bacterium]